MKSILEELRPDAVFCGNDYMAAGAMKSLSEADLSVLQGVSVVGYDNNDICEGVDPQLMHKVGDRQPRCEKHPHRSP